MPNVTTLQESTMLDFDIMQHKDLQTNNKPNNFIDKELIKLKKYNLKEYINDIKTLGLEKTWDNICNYVLIYGENEDFLNINNFGELYEIGLAEKDKDLKKKSGQYYTPEDVSLVMAEWFKKCSGENVCDVACGTGNLILSYLKILGGERTKQLINGGYLYLYDKDQIALKICKTAIMVRYNIIDYSLIHDLCCDFLDKNVYLPKNSKVISNPPYSSIKEIQSYWNYSDVLKDTKELYSTFMEKIVLQSKSAVIISPYSFISGSKFFSLRKTMCENEMVL